MRSEEEIRKALSILEEYERLKTEGGVLLGRSSIGKEWLKWVLGEATAPVARAGEQEAPSDASQ